MECLVLLYIWISPIRTPQSQIEIHNKDVKSETNRVAALRFGTREIPYTKPYEGDFLPSDHA